MKIWDQDLDLRPDLLLATRDLQMTPYFFHNRVVDTDVVLLDETAHVGLDDGHEAGGLTVLDWNRDGDKDIYVGRQSASQKVYYRTTNESGGQDLGKHFINVKLSSPQSVNNQAAIGARISIEVNGNWYHQWVDGGSGRGGQDDLAVTFAVPDTNETYPVQVRWPNGWVQDVDAEIRHYDGQNPAGEDPQVFLDNTNPTVVSTTVVGSTAFNAAINQYYWVFSWETEYRSDWSQDSVTVISSACVPATQTFTATSTGVISTVGRKTSGRYVHTLKVPVTCSAPCTIPFTVASSHRTGITSSSSQKSFIIKFCPSGL